MNQEESSKSHKWIKRLAHDDIQYRQELLQKIHDRYESYHDVLFPKFKNKNTEKLLDKLSKQVLLRIFDHLNQYVESKVFKTQTIIDSHNDNFIQTSSELQSSQPIIDNLNHTSVFIQDLSNRNNELKHRISVVQEYVDNVTTSSSNSTVRETINHTQSNNTSNNINKVVSSNNNSDKHDNDHDNDKINLSIFLNNSSLQKNVKLFISVVIRKLQQENHDYLNKSSGTSRNSRNSGNENSVNNDNDKTNTSIYINNHDSVINNTIDTNTKELWITRHQFIKILMKEKKYNSELQAILLQYIEQYIETKRNQASARKQYKSYEDREIEELTCHPQLIATKKMNEKLLKSNHRFQYLYVNKQQQKEDINDVTASTVDIIDNYNSESNQSASPHILTSANTTTNIDINHIPDIKTMEIQENKKDKNNTVANRQQYFDALYKYQDILEEKKDKLRHQYIKEDDYECTFKPSLPGQYTWKKSTLHTDTTTDSGESESENDGGMIANIYDNDNRTEITLNQYKQSSPVNGNRSRSVDKLVHNRIQNIQKRSEYEQNLPPSWQSTIQTTDVFPPPLPALPCYTTQRRSSSSNSSKSGSRSSSMRYSINDILKDKDDHINSDKYSHRGEESLSSSSQRRQLRSSSHKVYRPDRSVKEKEKDEYRYTPHDFNMTDQILSTTISNTNNNHNYHTETDTNIRNNSHRHHSQNPQLYSKDQHHRHMLPMTSTSPTHHRRHTSTTTASNDRYNTSNRTSVTSRVAYDDMYIPFQRILQRSQSRQRSRSVDSTRSRIDTKSNTFTDHGNTHLYRRNNNSSQNLLRSSTQSTSMSKLKSSQSYSDLLSIPSYIQSRTNPTSKIQVSSLLQDNWIDTYESTSHTQDILKTIKLIDYREKCRKRQQLLMQTIHGSQHSSSRRQHNIASTNKAIATTSTTTTTASRNRGNKSSGSNIYHNENDNNDDMRDKSRIQKTLISPVSRYLRTCNKSPSQSQSKSQSLFPIERVPIDNLSSVIPPKELYSFGTTYDTVTNTTTTTTTNGVIEDNKLKSTLRCQSPATSPSKYSTYTDISPHKREKSKYNHHHQQQHHHHMHKKKNNVNSGTMIGWDNWIDF